MLSLRRLQFTILIAALVFMIGGTVFCATQSPTAARTTIYEVHLKSAFGDAGTRKMTLDGQKFLWEVSSPGVSVKLIKNPDGLFMLGRTSSAVKYARGDKREQPMGLFPGPIGDVKTFLKSHNAKSLDKAVLNKKKCMVYQYTESTSGWRCKLWVNAVTSMPVQIEMNGSKKADTVKATYLSYKLDKRIPASTFELPKGMKVRAMPDPNAFMKKPFGQTGPAAK
jgi:outer membrane lipoprotein-sorting protein